jgi:hypothetical protein
VKASGAQWTVLRCSWFNQNFSENYLLEPIRAGEVALPAPNIGEPFLDADDIADVAVAALTDDKHIGQLSELTGPRLLTFGEAIAQIAKASGREIRYVQVPMDEYVVALEQAQLPPDFVALIKYLFTEVLDGRNAHSVARRGILLTMRVAPQRTAYGHENEDLKMKTLPCCAGEGWEGAKQNSQFQLFSERNSLAWRSASSRFRP